MTEIQSKRHIERFTKKPAEGRCGFLLKTTDNDLAVEEITENDRRKT